MAEQKKTGTQPSQPATQQPATQQPATQQPAVQETKEARFIRLANRRVNKALRQLDTIVNLGNRNQYSYTPAQFERLFDALVTRISAIKAAFTAGSRPSDSGFSVNG